MSKAYVKTRQGKQLDLAGHWIERKLSSAFSWPIGIQYYGGEKKPLRQWIATVAKKKKFQREIVKTCDTDFTTASAEIKKPTVDPIPCCKQKVLEQSV